MLQALGFQSIGTKAALLASAPELQNLNKEDKEKLTADEAWVPTQARGYFVDPSVHTAVALLDTFEGPNAKLADGKVYQLNYVEIEAPSVGENVCAKDSDRIWLCRARVRDQTATKEIGMRQKAALQLAGLDAEAADSNRVRNHRRPLQPIRQISGWLWWKPLSKTSR